MKKIIKVNLQEFMSNTKKKLYIIGIVLCILLSISLLYFFMIKTENHKNYVFTTKWNYPEKGTFLSSIAVDYKGNIYVAATDCIQKFDSNGKFIMKCGNDGDVNCNLNKIVKIAINQGENIYVINEAGKEIKKFNSNGKFITKWKSTEKNTTFTSITVHPFIYIFTTSSDASLNIFLSGGTCIKKCNIYNPREQTLSFTPEVNFWIEDIVIDRWGYSYIVHESSYLYDATYVSPKPGQNLPSMIPLNPKFIYESYIRKYSPLGVLFTSFDLEDAPWKNDWYNGFNSKIDMTVDSYGFIFIAYPAKNCILKIDPSGKLITRWGSKGSGDGQFNNPTGVAVDKEGNVYVMDTGNYRIQKFKPVY